MKNPNNDKKQAAPKPEESAAGLQKHPGPKPSTYIEDRRPEHYAG